MNRSWMFTDRTSQVYEQGVDHFLEVATVHASSTSSILCPCIVCGNLRRQPIEEIKNHLFFHGIDQSYRVWIWHGEKTHTDSFPSKNGLNNARQQFETSPLDDLAGGIEMVQVAQDECMSDPDMFKKLLEDAEKPLYPGCTKFTKLSALVKLYNLKASNGWSNTGFSELLELLGDMLPINNEMPLSMYEAKKTFTALGVEYEKIHACPNDCILYRKEYIDATTCPTCGESRWKRKRNSIEPRDGVPAKVLWYFPPIPRFRRMFQSAEIAKDLTWHANQRQVDGQLRHPADSPSWKLVDHKWPDFAAEARNLRLALSADGINPHSSLSSRYSCWPVILTTYNLPPWLCMKRKFMMLSLLISGPKQPGKDIDVYLAPLIDDLKMLWEVGIEAFDAYKQQSFTLRAVLLWTINDFPAYGNLSGCCVKGYRACPICGEKTYSLRLKHGKKNSYTGHRRFLPLNHPYRKQMKAFNGKQEFDLAPSPLSGEEILRKIEAIPPSWGKKKDAPKVMGDKTTKKRKKVKSKNMKNDPACWNKKSIFFDLEYWKHLHVRHLLDVMHIEKNVCDSIIGTLLNIPGKTKDTVTSRKDLVVMGLRKKLAPQYGKNRTYLPAACYTLSREEKRKVCKTLLDLKVPEGYSSNLRNKISIQDLKLYGLKSHDCHVLMQQILPVAIRAVLPKHVRYAIIRFYFFFNAICSKVVDVSKLDEIQKELVITLCLFEKYFPPSFFDVMVHLTVHLIREVRLCGPVYFRWMYPFERFMKVLKGYVRNRNRPEGCIAECYVAEEAVEFCADYISGVNAIGIPSDRDNKTRDDMESGRPLTGGCVVQVDHQQLKQAHRYILQNTTEVQPYIEDHMIFLKQTYPRQSKNQKWLHIEHNNTFSDWLREKVEDELSNKKNISENLKWIAHGPRDEVIKYPGYIINGCRYHTRDRDNSRVNQNSGVSLVATTMQISGAKDKHPVYADMCYYGVVTEIWNIDYHMIRIPVFKCDWVDNKKGIKVDDLGFTIVDLGRIGHKTDSFILASQAKQVFYVEDQLDPRCSVVLTPPKKDYRYDGYEDELDDGCIEHHDLIRSFPNDESFQVDDDEIDDEEADDDMDSAARSRSLYARADCEGVWVDHTTSE